MNVYGKYFPVGSFISSMSHRIMVSGSGLVLINANAAKNFSTHFEPKKIGTGLKQNRAALKILDTSRCPHNIDHSRNSPPTSYASFFGKDPV